MSRAGLAGQVAIPRYAAVHPHSVRLRTVPLGVSDRSRSYVRRRSEPPVIPEQGTKRMERCGPVVGRAPFACRAANVMSLLSWIVLGLIAGYIASRIVNRTGEGIIVDILLGIVGAIVGGWLFRRAPFRSVRRRTKPIAAEASGDAVRVAQAGRSASRSGARHRPKLRGSLVPAGQRYCARCWLGTGRRVGRSTGRETVRRSRYPPSIARSPYSGAPTAMSAMARPVSNGYGSCRCGRRRSVSFLTTA